MDTSFTAAFQLTDIPKDDDALPWPKPPLSLAEQRGVLKRRLEVETSRASDQLKRLRHPRSLAPLGCKFGRR